MRQSYSKPKVGHFWDTVYIRKCLTCTKLLRDIQHKVVYIRTESHKH